MEEKVFANLESHYEEASDPTMINYARFVADIDIVFNLPVRID